MVNIASERHKLSNGVRLEICSEYIGHLEDVEVGHKVIKLRFRNGDIIKINCSTEMAQKLRRSIGKKISVLHTDDPEKSSFYTILRLKKIFTAKEVIKTFVG
ncbi:hypothetical protein Asulf_02175 [Archaeoglobus sulfaticallidus PM70-1]|uniref:Uncharacterized protein n=1 Tax=Archaeoglobus sulfaticallidus PM70-1 TaxID=387631 RepID=N0BGJ8_9EURY|nr:hypothetical protein [Archaeoglobus sulfaticallidus]AGK62128.1 hypothetical protein Asulf_02175 [Archaeoglobus sulfaticallidus PM70-1]